MLPPGALAPRLTRRWSGTTRTLGVGPIPQLRAPLLSSTPWSTLCNPSTIDAATSGWRSLIMGRESAHEAQWAGPHLGGSFFWVRAPPFGATPCGAPPFGAPPFGAPPFTLRGPTVRGPTLRGSCFWVGPPFRAPSSPLGPVSLKPSSFRATRTTSHPNRPPHPTLKTEIWCWANLVWPELVNVSAKVGVGHR